MACLLLLLLCGDIESQPSPTNNSEFKTLILKKGINFCHQNFRGLYGNIDEVQEILLSHNFDIFSLSETSISEDFHNAFFDIRGYSFIRRDRKSGQGGGAGLYIRDGIDFARRPDLENDETESLWVEIRLKNTKPFIFGTIYKPPDSSKHLSKNFNFFLSKTLQSIDSEKRESIIMGDMNVNYLIENDHEVIKDIFTDNGFKQILNTPMRVTDQTSSLIDLIFVNNNQNISYKTVIPTGLSHHDLIACVRKVNNVKHESETIHYRDYKNYGITFINNELLNINWDGVYNSNSPNQSLNVIKSILKDNIDRHAPFVTKRVKGKKSGVI